MVSEVSEERLLRPILDIFAEHNRLVAESGGSRLELGPGDDCAVFDQTDGRTVVTVDTQTQGQDYLLEYPCGYVTSGFDLGWKSAAQNLADVAAMGGTPTGLVISLTLPPTTPLDLTRSMARGYCAAIRALGAQQCTVGGGDVGSGTELSATVAAFGLVDRAPETTVPSPQTPRAGTAPVLRSGAEPGDVVVLAGTVGRAAAGLELLLNEKSDPPTRYELEPESSSIPWAAPSSEPAALAASQLRPLPPLALGPTLARAGATAMIDVSDGLLRDAERVARASGVAIDIDSTRLGPLVKPLERAAGILGSDPLDWVLSGGEDHGILGCVPSTAQLPDGVIAIGSCGEKEDRAPWVGVDGRSRDRRGWDHFAAKDRL